MRKEYFQQFSKWLKQIVESEKLSLRINTSARLNQYEKYLNSSGFDEKEISERINIIKDVLFSIDTERWNKYYSENTLVKQKPPNAFLVQKLKNLSGNSALDVGMGEGRNTLYLARQGWKTVGLEASKQGILCAKKQVVANNINPDFILTNIDDFDFGENRWDLILLFYVPLRSIAEKVIKGLSENGSILIEAYHSGSADSQIIGDLVVFENNELLEIFNSLNVYFYEEKMDISDFAAGKVPIVRLHAGKM